MGRHYMPWVNLSQKAECVVISPYLCQQGRMDDSPLNAIHIACVVTPYVFKMVENLLDITAQPRTQPKAIMCDLIAR